MSKENQVTLILDVTQVLDGVIYAKTFSGESFSMSPLPGIDVSVGDFLCVRVNKIEDELPEANATLDEIVAINQELGLYD